MLTRLEAHGFKNLLEFALDFGPVTCIAGPNAVGKSNILDVIHFLSLLSNNTIMEAALRVRGGDPETSEVRDLFWTDGERRADSFRLAAEMIVDKEVKDDFGRPAEATSTFLRYEVEIGYSPPSPDRGLLGNLTLVDEKLDYITQGDAHKHLHFEHSAQDFRRTIVRNRRRSTSGFISSKRREDGTTEIHVHQDGGSRGPAQKALAQGAPRTIVATSNTSSTPTILAARREMQSWRLLALEPSAMRRPDRFQDEQRITINGGHLPGTLYRLGGKSENDTRENGQQDVYAQVASRLADLVPVSAVTVERDDERRLLTLEVTEESGIRLPASSLSDGTLRFLALSVMTADPDLRGVICMEEPENGIHPARMGAMVELLQALAVEPDIEPGSSNPMRQVVVATHSPVFVKLQARENLVFALEAKLASERGRPRSTIRCHPLDDTWRAKQTGRSVGLATVLDYLTDPPGSQLRLPNVSDRKVSMS